MPQRSGSRRESDKNEEMSPEKRKRLTYAGHTLRIVHFILNAFVWVVANLAIFGGFIVGFSTDTIVFPFQNLDFMATTPVIILVEYGLFQVFVASVGCFTGTSANPIAIGVYIICAIILLIIDLVWGVCLYFWPDALPIFMNKVKASMNGYGVEGADLIGIYPLEPKVYWDHIQLRGKCCGAEEWEEWINTTIGSQNSIPYSCCDDSFRYAECCDRVLGPYMHPFSEHHGIEDMIFRTGCFAKLPRSLRNSFKETGALGVVLGTFLILAILVAIVLLALILTKLYLPADRKKSKNEKDRARRNTLANDDTDNEFNPNRRRSTQVDDTNPRKKPKRKYESAPEISGQF